MVKTRWKHNTATICYTGKCFNFGINMAKKYSECLKCGIDTPLNYAKYCDSCRREISIAKLKLANKNKHLAVGKEKACENCGKTFLTKGPASKYCESCGPIIHKRKFKESHDKYRRRKGVKVGVGSGNNQGYGETHHSFKDGIALYQRIVKDNKEPFCERCHISINYSDSYSWCCHHRDHNRQNNNLSNLELLCKRCHQIEHNCQNNLPNK